MWNKITMWMYSTMPPRPSLHFYTHTWLYQVLRGLFRSASTSSNKPPSYYLAWPQRMLIFPLLFTRLVKNAFDFLVLLYRQWWLLSSTKTILQGSSISKQHTDTISVFSREPLREKLSNFENLSRKCLFFARKVRWPFWRSWQLFGFREKEFW